MFFLICHFAYFYYVDLYLVVSTKLFAYLTKSATYHCIISNVYVSVFVGHGDEFQLVDLDSGDVEEVFSWFE